ncbi:MAG: hypothetical protein J6A60_07875, partial [Clostridia bacterium]|nr:hypothetical protein [Clostridia bacterium]
MKTFIKLLSVLLVFSLIFGVSSIAYAEESAVPEMIEYGFVDCGDAKVEYGIYGLADGEPLLLLSPNGGDMHCFDGSILPEMSKHFKVITVSTRGTGNSDWVEGTMNFDVFAEDVLKLLDHLGIAKTN